MKIKDAFPGLPGLDKLADARHVFAHAVHAPGYGGQFLLENIFPRVGVRI